MAVARGWPLAATASQDARMMIGPETHLSAFEVEALLGEGPWTAPEKVQ